MRVCIVDCHLSYAGTPVDFTRVLCLRKKNYFTQRAPAKKTLQSRFLQCTEESNFRVSKLLPGVASDGVAFPPLK